MKTQKPRILIRKDGRDLAFCHLKFRKALSGYVNKRREDGFRITQTDLCQNLADHLCLSTDSINNYKKGHNGPASIGVVQDMAAYLELEWTELMKEVSPMTEKKMVEKEMAEKKKMEAVEKEMAKTKENVEPTAANTYRLTKYEKKAAWRAARKVYKALLDFVSYFEGDYTVELDLEDASSDPIIRSYNYCWTILHKHMLDIPHSTYESLEELIRELQYWIYGLPEYDSNNYDPAEELEKLRYFRSLWYLELNEEFEEEESEWKDRVTTWVVREFYETIHQILKNYIPREQAAGDARRQTNTNSETIYNEDFWNALDELVNSSEIVIDRPKGSAHPKFPDFIYRVDYGYMKDTSSMDGAGIDVWVGSGEKKVDAIMCIVDLAKRDSEIKILIGCTEEEKMAVYKTHNETQFMKGILIRR